MSEASFGRFNAALDERNERNERNARAV